MKQFSIRFLLTVLMSMIGAKAFAYDIAVQNADGVTIYYNYINDGLELEVTSIGSLYGTQYRYRDNIVIPEEVTYLDRKLKVISIGSKAFSGSRLTSVTIPNSVTSIGEDAFNTCSYLTSINIPNSVTSIGSKAFAYCSGLTSINIPNSITTISSSAFEDCSGLTSINIPNSITTISSSAFSGCSGLTSINIPNSVLSIGSESFFGCSGLTSVTIPNSVTSIGSNAFAYCSGLTSVTIPNSVTSIGSSAFSDCSGLTSVTIPNSVTSIGSEAFYWCSKLASVTIGENVTSIGDHAFANSGLTSIKIPNSVTTIESAAFQNCNVLSSVALGSNVTSIFADAFRNCSSITSITIPNSVTFIGGFAFAGCSSLTKAVFHCPEIGQWFSDTNLKEIIIGDEVTSIGNAAFSNCSGLTSVTIPNSVTTIESAAFQNCNVLSSVALGSNVTSIFADAFRNCSSITSITIPNSVTFIGGFAFAGCSSLTKAVFHCPEIGQWFSDTNLKEIIIGDEVTSIGNAAFSNCSGLTSVTIPNSVTSIGSSAFQGCSGLTSVTIPNSVTSIGSSAFSDCSGLTSVTIPNSVTSIGSAAFSGCSNLQSIVVGNGITVLPSSVFSIGKSLKSLAIGAGVLSINPDIFGSSSYKPIKTIWLTNTPPSGYTYAAGTVNYVANDQYTSLKNPTVYQFLSSMFVVDGVRYVPVSPSERTCDAIDCMYDETAEIINIGQTVANRGVTMTVKQVNPYAFYDNNFIKDVNLGLKGSIGSSAFCSCSLKTATLGNEVSSIGESAFRDCSALQGIVIPDAVKTLGSYAFSGCLGMKSAKMGSGVSTIERGTFYSCSSLTDLQIGSSVATINDDAFQGCTALPSIHIPKAVTNVGNYVFSRCTSLAEVSMDDSKTELTLGSNGSNPLFSSCPLKNVYIGRNISYHTSSNYGYSPFYRNKSLYSVTITDEETEISDNEFYGCTSLKIVRIGDGVQTIGNWAFSGCANLDDFSFGSSLQTIGKEAFSDCTAVTKLYSKASTPPACGNQALDDINKWNCTLYVPVGKMASYQGAEQWKEFFFIEESGQSSEDITIGETISISDMSKSTYCSSNDLDFSEFGDDLKAYVATGYDPDSKTIWMTRVTDVPAGTGIFLKGKKGDYQVPVKASTSYYKNMLVGTQSSTNIPSSTSEYTNLYLAKDGGELKFCTIAGTGRTMGANKAYLQIPKTFKSRPASATATTESIKLTEGKSTYCSSNDLDFTSMGDALKAYVATGYTNSTGTIWMTRVYDVPAGTGIFLKGENKTHSVPTKVKGGSSQYESYLVNMLVGTLTKTHISSTTDTYKNMYLTKEDGVLKFCGIAGDGRDMNANRAYLQIPLGVLSKTRSASFGEASYAPEFCDDVIGIPVEFGSTTSIMKVSAEDVEGDNVWYNLNGQRVENPGKGLYIRNGRKVVIK